MTAKIYPMAPLLQAAEIYSNIDISRAIGAFNINFYAQAEGVAEGAYRAKAPVIIQASKGACKFQGGADKIRDMWLKVLENCSYNIVSALHLDHGDEKSSKDCAGKGFTSVMIDTSDLEDFDNISKVREIVNLAHPKGITVEAELGKLKGKEEDIQHNEAVYTDPNFVPHFLRMSEADALAIAYGTLHGQNKGKKNVLRTDIVKRSYLWLKEYKMNNKRFLVSHGSSTVPQDIVDEINMYGGNLKETSGVPEEKIREVIKYGIRKVNIDTDLRLGITAVIRRYLAENDAWKTSEPLKLIKDVFDGKIPSKDKDGKLVDPAEITDPRNYLEPVKDKFPGLLNEDYRKSNDAAFIEVMSQVKERIANHVVHLTNLFNSAGLAENMKDIKTLEDMIIYYSKK